ncbi:MAG: hypothetical protein ACYCO3_16465 [Mycobacteriales bacterium]
MTDWIDDEVAARWATFPIDAVPRPIVLLDNRVRVEGAFIDGESKMAWSEGAITPDDPIAAALAALLRSRGLGRAHTALRITEATTTVAPFRCDRGPRDLPAYRLQLTGLHGSCVMLAPEVECWWPTNEADQHPGSGAAAIDDDGVTIHFPAFGGVLTEFHRAEFCEHPAYVVGRAVTSERRVAPGTAVVLLGINRKVLGRLRAPLGGRVLLNRSGQPLEVTPSGASDA